MSKRKYNKNLKRPEPQPLPSDYDLVRALNAIRKGSAVPYDSTEGTKTDVKIGSVNFNVWSNSGPSLETDSRLGEKYVTEKDVESIVNNLRADQTNSSTRLQEHFNNKFDTLNEKIGAVKDKCLSKSGFGVGIGVAVSIIGIIAGFVIYYVQDYKSGLDSITGTVKDSNQKIEIIESRVDSLEKSVIGIKESQNTQKQQKK